MNALDWLNQHEPGYRQLGSNEHEAITGFALLWTLFESRLLDEDASPRELIIRGDALQMEGAMVDNVHRRALNYFRRRYFSEGEFTHHFDGLRFKKNADRELVMSVLRRNGYADGHELAALFLIIYRLRNNLFHGVKWAYGIRDQLENFSHAIDVLMKALEQRAPGRALGRLADDKAH